MPLQGHEVAAHPEETGSQPSKEQDAVNEPQDGHDGTVGGVQGRALHPHLVKKPVESTQQLD